MISKKITSALVIVGVLAASVTTTASAGDRYSHGNGNVAAAVVGGLLLGAVIANAATPRPAYATQQVYQTQPQTVYYDQPQSQTYYQGAPQTTYYSQPAPTYYAAPAATVYYNAQPAYYPAPVVYYGGYGGGRHGGHRY